MKISELLGMDRQSVLTAGVHQYATNEVNGTIEVENVTWDLNSKDEGEHNVLLFFDLMDRSKMIMALVKFEDVSWFQLYRLKKLVKIRCKEYIGGLTRVSSNSFILSYTHENIVNAL